jgi:transposase-like protein
VKVEKAPKAKAERKPRAAKAFKLFDKVEAKDGDPEGSSRFWCHGCQDSFVSETDKPEACANGHRADDAEREAVEA